MIAGRTTDDLQQPDQPQASLSEFTPELAALYDVIDRLGDVCSGLVGLGGGSPSRPRPVPRPKSAFQRIAIENRRAYHSALWERIKPREIAP